MQPDSPETPGKPPAQPKQAGKPKQPPVPQETELGLWDFDDDLGGRPPTPVRPAPEYFIPPAPVSDDSKKSKISRPILPTEVPGRLEPTSGSLRPSLPIRERKQGAMEAADFEKQLQDAPRESWEDLGMPDQELPNANNNIIKATLAPPKEEKPIILFSWDNPAAKPAELPAERIQGKIKATGSSQAIPESSLITDEESADEEPADEEPENEEPIDEGILGEQLTEEEPKLTEEEPADHDLAEELPADDEAADTDLAGDPHLLNPTRTEAPLKPRVRLVLNRFERIGLSLVAMLVLAGGIFAMARFFRDIPTQKARDLAPAFPVTGELLTVREARTYWREPIRNGPGADKARMETRLIPVLELTLAGTGNGVIRVLFRDDQGTAIGDSITLQVKNGTWEDSGQTTRSFSSTAGFDDLGMYAAYRTGGAKPWHAEILEGPSPDAPRSKFNTLCNVSISTERR